MKTQERLLAALREARAQLEDAKAEALEPVAVVGMACRFPGSGPGIESFWQDLRAGADAVREITRWNVDQYYDPAPDSPGKMYVRQAALVADIVGNHAMWQIFDLNQCLIDRHTPLGN